MDILEKLTGLQKQATTDRSHYYVAKCCDEAIAEIKRLRFDLAHISNIASGVDSHETNHIYKVAREAIGVQAPFPGSE